MITQVLTACACTGTWFQGPAGSDHQIASCLNSQAIRAKASCLLLLPLPLQGREDAGTSPEALAAFASHCHSLRRLTVSGGQGHFNG